jgi:vacuolar-type H+-ATPase subunit D/Vma8
MENWRIEMEAEEQVDRVQNAVKIKAEPEYRDLVRSCIDIEEHPVKLEQSDTLICGLPAPDMETSDHEQPHNTGV